MSSNQPAAPSYLSPKRKALYLKILDTWMLTAPAIESVESACRLLDLADEARKVVDKEGVIVAGARGHLTENPALASERTSRREAHNIFSRLGVNSGGE